MPARLKLPTIDSSRPASTSADVSNGKDVSDRRSTDGDSSCERGGREPSIGRAAHPLSRVSRTTSAVLMVRQGFCLPAILDKPVYTIRQAAARALPQRVPIIRVWERRYSGPPTEPHPGRLPGSTTTSRSPASEMRRLVADEGWQPSRAAQRVLEPGAGLGGVQRRPGRERCRCRPRYWSAGG